VPNPHAAVQVRLPSAELCSHGQVFQCLKLSTGRMLRCMPAGNRVVRSGSLCLSAEYSTINNPQTESSRMRWLATYCGKLAAGVVNM
jgi:hypothetical protein